MWPDNETDRDFLNFTGVADTVAEIIIHAKGRPISIGVSGAWGVGKSSMIRIVRRSLTQRSGNGNGDFIFVDFNAWLYQGYDDARAALMEVIGERLIEEAEKRKNGLDKAREFLERVRWFRLAKLVVGSAAALYAGLPPEGLGSEMKDAASGLLDAKKKSSPPQEIHALRESFEKTLEAMNVTLVVMIDDLDRCLPETTISTLEAIRLFLFLKNTAFVIAADDAMIKYAVRRHFPDVTDDLVINYFDKLIQVPIRVPPLGTQEVRGYMMLLYVENSGVDESVKEKLRADICKQLGQTWQGKRVDRAFLQSLYDKFDHELVGKFDTADRLAPLMTTASGILGNPRVIKRFLNALAIRMAISNAHGVGVDEAVLAKMLLFERIGDPKAYAELTKAVTESSDGKPAFLSEWEEKVNAGQKVSLQAPWDDPFVLEWLTLPPRIADRDLRGVLYVSREHAPLISPQDRLSSEAAELLTALLQHPDMAANLKDRLSKVPRTEITVIMDRLLDRARQEQEWGVPPVLEACLVTAGADAVQGARLAAFLSERPVAQIKASIIPKISDQPWATSVFEKWDTSTGLSDPVRKAIKQQG
ncbi:KAP family P-loop NTPase fold protein [Candidatus Nitrospira nitrificans]|uniref:ATPase n=1 Tax=Candidatus Nitrospira nitrificans TaxID=1742973 RepID=A0A0S4LKM8_9BACT|nr:P-loop NTPase fold protein [Candidatus Nitrospira nitrificans]CUS37823.1 ATPase [Candidatus Nitrospira nitrificans]